MTYLSCFKSYGHKGIVTSEENRTFHFWPVL
jgi:hypothetical protein